MRKLTPDETRIYNAVGRKLLDLGDEHQPTHVVVYRDMFLNIGTLHGMKVIRAGYLPRDQAALLVVVDDIGRTVASSLPEPWFDTCQTIDCQAWPTWRVVDDRGRVVRGSYNCDQHRPVALPPNLGDRYEHRARECRADSKVGA
jgi:hypothetical protein